MIAYFSGTGNSRWVAEHLASLLRDTTLVDIAECVTAVRHGAAHSACLSSGEKLGLVFPVYGWDVPPIVGEFLKSLSDDAPSSRYVYFCATCGDDTGRMRQRFEQLIAPLGYQLSAAAVLRMPDCYICLPGFDVDKPVERQSKLASVGQRLAEFAHVVAEGQADYYDTIPGAMPWLKTYVLGWGFRKWLTTDKPFVSLDSCNGCKRCASQCPVGNIEIVDDRPQWSGHCTMCLRCYHTCPSHAIHYGWATRGKGQYLLRRYLNEIKAP